MNLVKNKKVIVSIVCVCIIIAIALSVIVYKKAVKHIGEGGHFPDYYITYKTDDGTILARDGIQRTAPAISKTLIPENPGRVFIGWDKDIRTAEGDIETIAQYLDVKNENNVIALSTRYGKLGDIVKFPLRVLGNVKLCGADITLSYDTELLKFIKDEKTDKAVTVEKDSKACLIYVRFVGADNANGELDLTDLCFKVMGTEQADTDIKILVKDIVQIDSENNIVSADYGVVDAKMYIY